MDELETMNPDPGVPPARRSVAPSQSGQYLPDLWHLMAGRIAPQTCCRYPFPMQREFMAAVREVSREDGDLDLAVICLHDIISNAPSGGMVFEQAGQLLNIIEWRRSYHPAWFRADTRGSRLKPGTCGPYIAQALALLEAGADDKALSLTAKIVEKGDEESDDLRAAYLIRAAIFICTGEIAMGEDEFAMLQREIGRR